MDSEKTIHLFTSRNELIDALNKIGLSSTSSLNTHDLDLFALHAIQGLIKKIDNMENQIKSQDRVIKFLEKKIKGDEKLLEDKIE
jgi:hypothetical protein